MATYAEQLQHIWKSYEDAGHHAPTTAREVARWAIEHGLWVPRPSDIESQCAEELARAAREEFRTDSRGRRYRARHSIRINDGAVQISLWADIDTAPRSHMEKAFAQRRKQIVGDCHHLKVDVDHYNDAHTGERPIQMVLDFTDDVAEIQAMEGSEQKIAI